MLISVTICRAALKELFKIARLNPQELRQHKQRSYKHCLSIVTSKNPNKLCLLQINDQVLFPSIHLILTRELLLLLTARLPQVREVLCCFFHFTSVSKAYGSNCQESTALLVGP